MQDAALAGLGWKVPAKQVMHDPAADLG